MSIAATPESPAHATHPYVAELAREKDRLRRRLIESIAERCAASGYRRIALYGAGRHTAPIIRQPWAWHGIAVVAVLDDHPTEESLSGVPIVRAGEFRAPVDAVVISSDAHEEPMFTRALGLFGPRGVPVVRIYGGASWVREEPAASVRRLVERCGVSYADAAWLVENRDERHDATLPMLPPERTELHLRRYELAARFARGKRVLDIACGAGYGSRFLYDVGRAASVLGADRDTRAVDYARRRFGVAGPGTSAPEFRVMSATATGLADASIELITSFETIEHIPDAGAALEEFARILAPGGVLVASTPNDTGPTEHHAHSFTFDAFRRLVEDRFGVVEWVAQHAGDEPRTGALPPGMEPFAVGMVRPANFIAIARRA